MLQHNRWAGLAVRLEGVGRGRKGCRVQWRAKEEVGRVVEGSGGSRKAAEGRRHWDPAQEGTAGPGTQEGTDMSSRCWTQDQEMPACLLEVTPGGLPRGTALGSPSL